MTNNMETVWHAISCLLYAHGFSQERTDQLKKEFILGYMEAPLLNSATQNEKGTEHACAYWCGAVIAPCIKE